MPLRGSMLSKRLESWITFSIFIFKYYKNYQMKAYTSVKLRCVDAFLLHVKEKKILIDWRVLQAIFVDRGSN